MGQIYWRAKGVYTASGRLVCASLGTHFYGEKPRGGKCSTENKTVFYDCFETLDEAFQFLKYPVLKDTENKSKG